MKHKKQRSPTRKALRFFLILLIIGWLITSIILSYYYVFMPAYGSYLAICSPLEGKEFMEEQGLVMAGTVALGNGKLKESDEYVCPDPEDWKNITIHINEEHFNDQTYKHELCHVHQILDRKWTFGCDEPLKHYMIEVECYTAQRLPFFIWDKIYAPENNVTIMLV